MYESLQQRPLARTVFVRRVLSHLVVATLLLAASLAVGMAGYRRFEQLSWLDAFLNATMLLVGMGPVHMPTSDAGKLFAGLYALYAGLMFIVVAGLMVAPVLHRLMHRLHWDETP